MSPLPQKTWRARWIFPVDGPPLPGGTITIADDKIVAVEPPGMRKPDVDLGNVAILPGFVNTHTHLDLTGARGLCPPTSDFTQWLRSVIAFRRGRTPDEVRTDIAAGVAECIRHGTTLIGDIAGSEPRWTMLADAPFRSLIFHEWLGLRDERAEQAAVLYRSILDAPVRPEADTRVGFSPHAPYSVGIRLFELAAKQPHAVAIHLAESRDELELLQSLSGPFVDFLQELNVWDPDSLIASTAEVIRMFPRGIFIHGNYLDPATPFLPTQSLVVCPRTHAAFGHPPHPFPRMNVRVALGTDSLASNPDLDILAEARFLRRHRPEIEPATLLRMLTLSGAEALGFANVAGSLTPGKSADMVVLPLPADDRSDPHELVLDSEMPVSGLMFRGKCVIEPAV